MSEGTKDSSHVSSAKQLNLRCTYAEDQALTEACGALDLSLSSLIVFGMIQAIADLGMTLLDDTPPKIKASFKWPFELKRPDGESAKARAIAYVPAALHPTFDVAAWSLKLSLPVFAIGSALRLVALAKMTNERHKKSDPEKFNKRLSDVALPYGFDVVVRNNSGPSRARAQE